MNTIPNDLVKEKEISNKIKEKVFELNNLIEQAHAMDLSVKISTTDPLSSKQTNVINVIVFKNLTL